MALSPELKRMVSGKGGNAVNRVPNPGSFAKLAIVDQSAVIESVQRELDSLTDGLRCGRITPNHRGRGAALRNLRTRQKRLDKLAADFGFRREWRKRVKVPTITRPAA